MIYISLKKTLGMGIQLRGIDIKHKRFHLNRKVKIIISYEERAYHILVITFPEHN